MTPVWMIIPHRFFLLHQQSPQADSAYPDRPAVGVVQIYHFYAFDINVC